MNEKKDRKGTKSYQDDKALRYQTASVWKCILQPTSPPGVPAPRVHAGIFSWHNWAIRVTLMHHIYLLFITGRIWPDWPRLFLWQLFAQLLSASILECRVLFFFFLWVYPPTIRTKKEEISIWWFSNIPGSSGLEFFLQDACSRMRLQNCDQSLFVLLFSVKF